MKNIFCSCITAFLLFSCKPSPHKAAAYNDNVVAEISRIQQAEDRLISAVNKFEGRMMAEQADSFLLQLSASEKAIRAMEQFDGKDDLEAAAVAFISFFRSVAEREYRQITAIAQKEVHTPDDVEAANALLRQIAARRQQAIEKFSSVQRSFAERYGVSLGNR